MTTSRAPWLALAVAALLVAPVALGAAAQGRPGPLTGSWSGSIAGLSGSRVQRQHIDIVINAKETAGRYRIGPSCHGPLTLDSISYGYHHYRRRAARGSTCAVGDVDCLKRVGAGMLDAVTSHQGGAYDSSGTLRRLHR